MAACKVFDETSIARQASQSDFYLQKTKLFCSCKAEAFFFSGGVLSCHLSDILLNIFHRYFQLRFFTNSGTGGFSSLLVSASTLPNMQCFSGGQIAGGVRWCKGKEFSHIL